MVLAERLKQELKDLYTRLNNDGKLFSHAQLSGYYETFRKRFGPDQLKSFDGETLLELMHDHTQSDVCRRTAISSTHRVRSAIFLPRQLRG